MRRCRSIQAMVGASMECGDSCCIIEDHAWLWWRLRRRLLRPLLLFLLLLHELPMDVPLVVVHTKEDTQAGRQEPGLLWPVP